MTTDIGIVVTGNRSNLPASEVDVLRPVASEINRLIDRNAQRLAETRVHFANMAHGLKTRVASMMLALDDHNDPDGSLRRLVDRIDRRIRHHLADGRRSSTGDLVRTVSVVKQRLDDLILALERIYADKQLLVDGDIDPSLSVGCAADDFDGILGNILDNAFKWATGKIQICALRKERTVKISIRDDGPGIPNASIEQVFRPGLRLDEIVPGDGFGLSISKDLIDLYVSAISIVPKTQGLSINVEPPFALPPNRWKRKVRQLDRGRC